MLLSNGWVFSYNVRISIFLVHGSKVERRLNILVLFYLLIYRCENIRWIRDMEPLRLNISVLSVLLCCLFVELVSMTFACTSAVTILYRRRSEAQSFFNILTRFCTCLLAFFVHFNYKRMFEGTLGSLTLVR